MEDYFFSCAAAMFHEEMWRFFMYTDSISPKNGCVHTQRFSEFSGRPE
ncbi:MAG: hypothetical protein Q4C96_07135 [Planctomycetia bacterium]|nr:hypothetical protein [Planctomycetia bacterium]